MPRFPLILAIPALVLAACGGIGDFRPRLSSPVAPVPVQPVAPIEAEPAVAGAGAAEAACVAAGRERGFEVQTVVGSADVAGNDGQPASRDVMLRVARGSQVFDLRCNYHYASAQARVMAL